MTVSEFLAHVNCPVKIVEKVPFADSFKLFMGNSRRVPDDIANKEVIDYMFLGNGTIEIGV